MRKNQLSRILIKHSPFGRKLDEAQTMIDLATTYEKTMNDGKTWYYRGLIYATIDTTSNEQHKALSDNAFAIAMESFEKSEKLSNGKNEYFINDAMGLPVLKSQQLAILSNSYLNHGATKYQDDDLEGAIVDFEKVQRMSPKDTIAYFYAGFVANAMEDYDKAISNFRKYVDEGGTSADAYSMLINISSGPKEDKEAALKIAREAKAKFPKNGDFPKVEIGLLIDLKRIDEAKKGLEDAIASEPKNKILHFYLGYANASLENFEAAKKNYQDALNIDPEYFESQLYLSKLVYNEAAIVKKEMSNLGISAADKKKRFELDKTLVEKLKVALPYWEKAEKINNSDQEVLDTLYAIYADLDDQAGIKRIEKRYKELGMDVE